MIAGTRILNPEGFHRDPCQTPPSGGQICVRFNRQGRVRIGVWPTPTPGTAEKRPPAQRKKNQVFYNQQHTVITRMIKW